MSEELRISIVRHSTPVVALGFAAVLALITTQLRADVVLPTGLAPGSRYEIAFLTTDTTAATSSDINYYNSFVKTEANQDAILAGIGATWHAIASTDHVNANVNAPNNGSIPIYNTKGQLLFDAANPMYSASSLMESTPLNLFYTQAGADSPIATAAWTGSDPLGNLASPTASMKTGLGDDYVEIGVPLDEFFGAIAWIDYGGIDSNENLYPIYALSSPITVPAPEPSTLLLLGIGAASLLAYAWRRRTRTA